MPNAPVQVLAQITIGLTPTGKVIFSANVPSREVAVMMLEVAKLDLSSKLLEQEANAAEAVIETPPAGFDHTKVPSPHGLRVAG